MRILLINYEFPPLGGGAGNATQNIARELAALGHEVLVLTTWFAGLLDDEILDGYRIIRLRAKRRRQEGSSVLEMLHFVWLAIKKSKTIVSDFRPEVMISFFALPTGIIGWYLKKKYRIPYVLSLRGGDVPGFLPQSLKYHHLFSAPIARIVWKNSDGIVANSLGLQALAKKTADKFNKTVDYIPNGVNPREFFPEANKVSADNLNILFVGRLVEQKGIIFLIQAIEQLVSQNLEYKTKIKCRIVGDGPLRSSLEREVANRHLENNFVFQGWVTRADLPGYYRQADIFVLPSFEEGMPNVILEAMASGLAIIATDIGGNNELVTSGQNGFLYRDHAELPQLINKFIINPALKNQFGLASLEKSRDFSWYSVAQKYINICQKPIRS